MKQQTSISTPSLKSKISEFIHRTILFLGLSALLAIATDVHALIKHL